MKRSLYVLFGLGIAVLPACNDPTGPEFQCATFLLDYGATVGDTVTLADDLRYIDVEAGSGAIQAGVGDVARVHFSSYIQESQELWESTCISSSASQPFTLGGSGIVEYFSDGMIGMRSGGVRRVIVPWELASPGLNDPQNPFYQQDLIYDIQLVELTDGN